MEVEDGDQIFVTNLHQPRKRSMLPPPSLNALQKPSSGTKTLLFLEKMRSCLSPWYSIWTPYGLHWTTNQILVGRQSPLRVQWSH